MKTLIVASSLLASLGKNDTLFSRGGITLVPAATSEEILNLHRSNKADLIITDFALPAMGGAKLAAAIRAEAELKDVSIIMACDADPVVMRSACDSGANAVLHKPLDSTELFLKVSELIVVPRRKDMRVLLRVSVSGGDAGAPTSFASSENISISGMLLETNHAFRKDDRLSCSFYIGHSKIDTQAQVMRVNRSSSGRYRCGVRFLNLDTKSMVVIEQFIKRSSSPAPAGEMRDPA